MKTKVYKAVDSMSIVRAMFSKKHLLKRAATTVYLDRQQRLIKLRRIK